MGSKPLVFVLLGPPGAGKGTQGDLLARRTGIRHISTGDLFRDAVCAQTPAGLRAEAYLESGELVPDEVVMQLVEEFITSRAGEHFCFDGFPRTRRQAEAFDALLAQLGIGVSNVIVIQVSDDIAMERLEGRGRSDDSPETVRQRLRVYHELTEPLIAYYRRRGVLREIDGSGDVESVATAIREAYEQAA